MKLGRREFILAAAAAAAPLRAARKPNVIVILADDLGYADLGFQGARDIPTPHLDRLAASGVRFTNACVSHPFCSPTRAGLLTGRYQHRFGHENNPVFNPTDEISGLPLSEVTLPQILKTAGYVCGIVGKWHLGAAPCFHPMRRGFDETYSFIGGGHEYLHGARPKPPKEYVVPIERDGKPEEVKDYLTEALSREASAFVRRHRKDPFFLYLAYNAPHTPLQVTERYLERVRSISDDKLRPYAAMICAMDDGVGELLKTLRETGLERDTLVFFLSDNGGPTHVTNARNTPLRGHKGQVFEGGIRVPFLMSWPGRLRAGATYAHPVISLDILPTAAAVAGASLPPGRKIDGVDLMPFLTGRSSVPPHERLFWRWGGGRRYAVREGRYKLVKEESGQLQLFDLEADIGEQNDLSSTRPDLRDRLEKAYTSWNSEMIQPVFPVSGGA